MDGLCTKCARLTIRAEKTIARSHFGTGFRQFSATSLIQKDDESSTGSQRPRGIESAGRSMGAALSKQAERPASGGLKIIRTPVDAPSGPRVVRQSRPPQQTGAPTMVRRTGAPPQGQPLRRTGPPRSGQPFRQGGAPRGQSPNRGPSSRPGQKPQNDRRRRFAARDEDDETDAEGNEKVEEYIRTVIDPPANPTEKIAYNPTLLAVSELRSDWPNTPLSAIGLSESVVQKIEWLARRLPHGYQTPEQIAEHFHKGNLTRFESEEEKQTVLKLATELAKARAAKLTERKGQDTPVEDMSLADLSTQGGEKSFLFNAAVKGDIEGLKKQRYPFLDTIAKNLQNNETYGNDKSAQFIQRIQSLLPQQRPAKAT